MPQTDTLTLLDLPPLSSGHKNTTGIISWPEIGIAKVNHNNDVVLMKRCLLNFVGTSHLTEVNSVSSREPLFQGSQRTSQSLMF